MGIGIKTPCWVVHYQKKNKKKYLKGIKQKTLKNIELRLETGIPSPCSDSHLSGWPIALVPTTVCSSKRFISGNSCSAPSHSPLRMGMVGDGRGPWLEQIKVTKASTFQRSGDQETTRATVEKKPSQSALVFIFRSFLCRLLFFHFQMQRKYKSFCRTHAACFYNFTFVDCFKRAIYRNTRNLSSSINLPFFLRPSISRLW